MMLQYALRRELSADVDVFSGGILFLEMFTGMGPKLKWSRIARTYTIL
jgi:hypothetical protein